MFGTKPKTVPPSHTVGTLAADALLGQLTMNLNTGMQLVKTFAAFNAAGKTDDALTAFAARLVDQDEVMAGKLVDLLAAKVGR